MSLKFITLFLEYAVPSYLASSVSKQELQKEMERKIAELEHDIGSVKPVHAESKQVLCSLVNLGCIPLSSSRTWICWVWSKTHPMQLTNFELVSEGITAVFHMNIQICSFSSVFVLGWPTQYISNERYQVNLEYTIQLYIQSKSVLYLDDQRSKPW